MNGYIKHKLKHFESIIHSKSNRKRRAIILRQNSSFISCILPLVLEAIETLITTKNI